MDFLQALKSRHSEYVLSKNIDITEDALTSYLKDILQYTPSAFNSESQRIVLLTQEKHDLLWEQLIEIMKGIVKGEQFENTKNKINAFKAAYGTILFFDDTSVTKKLQEKFPLYSENFAKWSIEQNGMLQSNVWVGLRTKNIGASLQHYNELIDDFVKKTFDIPETWELRAQMPFGHIEELASEKPHIEINKRFLLKK
ncbi:nitroreductase [Hujiaoplasma nucleasis]|uniref:Nitroreductase n=1 Tax=Hujiaoplasma nucleasis TaxID=2725268 RepID=A0A7L6N0X8_9MOLU|nr:nitroreductase family protein [Hujiaoplasma nucleasis]QLY39910.1 nitroreductase [Hujiaoplasma nucleasis]